MKKLIANYLVGAALLVLASTASAREVDETIDAASDGHVDIINISGSIDVYGWSKNRVEVTGELGNRVEELILERDGDKILVKVKVPRNNSNNISSDLTVRVPEDSSIDVSTVSADITSKDIKGEQVLHTVSGDLIAEPVEDDISAQTVSGDIDILGDGSDIDVEVNTVSGDITVIEVSGSIAAEVVSGEILVRDGSFHRATLNSVNGEIDYQAGLRSDGKLSVETINGDVDVQFSGDVSARFDIETFNGDISNCFGPKAQRTSKYTPGLELSFTEGSGDGRVTITTLNGDIDMCN
ncbi:MAG: DUF4097 family beta strand repeat-containing protein [Woeseiaceae bacterium]